MSSWVVSKGAEASVPVHGLSARFPVHRIYCIGRNYSEHAKEMGSVATPEDPIFFMKPADAVVTDGADVPYPQATTDLHHELELVLALAGGGRDLDASSARAAVYGYALGIDLTRRDLQAKAKAKGAPWDVAKGFDASAPIAAIQPIGMTGWLAQGSMQLLVNGQVRQQVDIADMVLPPERILMALSRLYTLQPGDLIFTGTPAGVAALKAGDVCEANMAGLPSLRATIV
ncbi:fumarylacetoacetate hydrolase [Ahniella affigens]|uniref:Fumarylacetoacetate hydrolase n=1 Tax=Ahniella affigens TaxID=2021234 RepID=A0A2P1PUB7_9GAMM|nr:fumarylacetoacetate hydrolase family protein [Ahniella affigens]AVP98434.1 fumarylacetoacetate hydrolase [Ahniella affigens]